MWDSAKKPIKIRTILKPDGSRYFMLNEIAKESCVDLLHTGKEVNKLNSLKKLSSCDIPNTNEETPVDNSVHLRNHHSVPTHSTVSRLTQKLEDFTLDRDKFSRDLPAGDTTFGVSGSKFCSFNKSQSRFKRSSLSNYHNASYWLAHKSESVDDDFNMESCGQATQKIEFLDMIPVQSPVIKSLLRSNLTNNHLIGNKKSKSNNNNSSGSISCNSSRESSLTPDDEEASGSGENSGNLNNTSVSLENKLCSKIMTWINLEVRKNGSINNRTFPPGTSPGELRMIAGELMPNLECLSTNNSFSSSLSSSATGSRRSSCNEQQIHSSSNSSTCNATTTSESNSLSPGKTPRTLPRLLVSNLKQRPKVKKSVRISDVLPKWRKSMKDENGESSVLDKKRKSSISSDRGSRNHAKGRSNTIVSNESQVQQMKTKCISTSNKSQREEKRNTKSNWLGANCLEDLELDESGYFGEVKIDDCTVYLMGETKSRPVCKIEVPETSVRSLPYSNNLNGEHDENLQGKVQVHVHIFLPVTE